MAETTPVANQVVPPDPTKGINTFSGILGLKQQQQALQLGQQQLQVGETQVQQSQQRNTELQNLSLFTQGAIKSGKYQLPDGSSDVQAFTKDAMGIAPTYGQEFIGRAASNFKEATESRRSLQMLSGEQNKQISDALKGIATKPNATPSDLLDAVSQIRSNNKDPTFNRALDNFLLGASRTSPQQAAANAASALGGLPQSTPAEMDIGGQIATGTKRTMGPGMGAFNPTGQVIQKTLNPAQTPGYLAQAAAASTTGGTSAQNDEQLYNQITQGATRVGQMKSLSGEVQQLAKEVKTGRYSKEGASLWTAVAQRVPGFGNAELTEATRRQLLGKYTQQLMLQAEQANGASTDAAQAHVQAAMPDPDHMSPDAIVDSARYVSGQADVANARAQLAMKHRGAQGNSQGLRDLDTRFMSQADPRAYVYQGLPAGEDRREYLRKHPDFKNQLLLKLHQNNQ